jgi:hypothetical protein
LMSSRSASSSGTVSWGQRPAVWRGSFPSLRGTRIPHAGGRGRIVWGRITRRSPVRMRIPAVNGEALAEGGSPIRQAAPKERPRQVVADDSRHAVGDDSRHAVADVSRPFTVTPPSRGEALAEGQSVGRRPPAGGGLAIWWPTFPDTRWPTITDTRWPMNSRLARPPPAGGLRPTLGSSPRASPLEGGVLPTIGPPRFLSGAHRMERVREYVNSRRESRWPRTWFGRCGVGPSVVSEAVGSGAGLPLCVGDI